MRSRGQATTFADRLAIAERAAAGESDAQIAHDLGCSIHVVRKWRRRYRDKGRQGLASQMGRPRSGALGTQPVEVKDALRALRQAHRGWGPDTLRIELQRQVECGRIVTRVPSRARIAAFLKAEQLTRRYQRHTALPQPERGTPNVPHAEWQLDAQGVVQVEGVGKCCLINILDRVSRLKIESYPCVGSRKPATEDYYLALRRAFLSWGLPERLSLDHDTVFFDNTTPSPFPTRLHLWLVALDVQVGFIRPRQPTDHAQIERTHQTMEAQALTGQAWSSASALWAGLDERRDVLNQRFPSAPLDRQAPLAVYPQASQSLHPYRPEWETDLLVLERVYRYLAQGRWFRYNNHGCFQLGASRYYVSRGHHFDGQMMEITFDPVQLVFLCQPETSSVQLPVAPKGLTKLDLMGEAAMWLTLPAYQLALPFSVEDRRCLELMTCRGDTTL